MITALILNTFFLFAPLDRPALTLAQGYTESGMNIKAVGKKGEKGAFQVIEKHWGKVPKTWKKQADQNQEIINELLDVCNGDIKKAVTKYNGKGKDARIYTAKVFKKAISIHILDIA